jgi:hypothetical protein
LGRAVTPRPWRPHTQSSAEQRGGTTHLAVTALRMEPAIPNVNPELSSARTGLVSWRLANIYAFRSQGAKGG